MDYASFFYTFDDLPPNPTVAQIRRKIEFTDLRTPGVGVILLSPSPVYETGSLKEISVTNDRSD